MATISIDTCIATTPHRLYEVAESGLWYCLPLLLQSLEQFLKIGSRRVMGTNPPPQHIPYMFNRAHIGRSSRPVESNHTLLLPEVCHHSSTMAWCVVILEDRTITYRLQGRQHKGPDYRVSVSNTGQAAVNKM